MILLHFAIGLVFGLGLILAGMANPAKVLAFLDIAAIGRGQWDPSLAFVMAGAIAVTLPGYRLVLRRSAPLLAPRFELPTATAIDRRILLGPAIFGIGWGLAGLCPGPAFVLLGTGMAQALPFMLAMLAGMFAARRLTR